MLDQPITVEDLLRSAKLRRLSGSVYLGVAVAISAVAIPNSGFAQQPGQLDTARTAVQEQPVEVRREGGGAGWLGLLGLSGLLGLAGLRGRQHHHQVHTVDRGEHIDTTRQRRAS